MACRLCGLEGHNARTCPGKLNSDDEFADKTSVVEPRDRTTIMRIEGMTQKEQDEIHNGIRDLKRSVIKHDTSNVTLIEGNTHDLPSKIRSLIDELENKLIQKKE